MWMLYRRNIQDLEKFHVCLSASKNDNSLVGNSGKHRSSANNWNLIHVDSTATK